MTASPDRRVAELVERAARPLGVERFGFCPLEALSGLLECRAKGLIPPKGAVILLLLPYYAGDFPGRNLARYALADDYHRIAGEILQSVASALQAAVPGERFLPFVDSSPIPEVEAGALAGLGFEIVDCDKLYYQLLARDGALRNALEAAFGPVFLPDGNLDRRRLAARVFGDPEELARLNALVYPAMSAAV